MAEPHIAELSALIVAAYVEKNKVASAALSELIRTVSASLGGLGRTMAPPKPHLEPAVNPKRSIFPDHIICLEDGKKFKSLKRHIGVHFNLTPEEYRQKWGLPADYPMVAPNYAAARSEMAKAMGLGRKRAQPAKSRKRG